MNSVEEHRRYWAGIAKRYGWFAQPFCVIVWLAHNGEVMDSVSYQGLDRDIIVRPE